MARAAKTTKTTKPAAAVRKPTRPTKALAKKPGKPAVAPKRMPVVVPTAPKLSVAELRALVEKLEGTVATLRAKNRDANRTAKVAATRIAELEDQLLQLEKKVASQTAPAKSTVKPTTVKPTPATRGKRKSRGSARAVSAEAPTSGDNKAAAPQALVDEHTED